MVQRVSFAPRHPYPAYSFTSWLSPPFQASEPVLPVHTSLVPRPPHWECPLVPEPFCPWVFAFLSCPLVGWGQAGKHLVAVAPKSNIWTLFSSHLDPKDLSLVQEGVISTVSGGREDDNNPLVLCSLDSAPAAHSVDGLTQMAFDLMTEHCG